MLEALRRLRCSFLFVSQAAPVPFAIVSSLGGSGWLFDYLSSALGPACYTNQQIAERSTVTSITFARNTHEREGRRV
jgi:hypothetical protein